MQRNVGIGSLCLFMASTIWGSMFVVSKYVLSEAPLFPVLWVRYFIAAVCLFVFLTRQKTKVIQRVDVPLILWLAFIGYFLSNSAGFYGTHLSSAHMGALLTAVSPVFTVVLAIFLLKERISIRKIGALGTALLGVLIVIGFEGEETGQQVWGNALLLFDAFCWGLFSVYVKKASYKYSALVVTTYSTVFALLMTTPFMLWQLDFQVIAILLRPDIAVCILFLGVVATAAAFYLWNKGMELLEAGVGSIFYFFAPLVGSFFGWIILDEKLTWNFFLGGLFIIIGAGYVSFGKTSSASVKEYS